LAAIRAQIAGAGDLIVHQARLAGGVRRVSSIVEVVGLDSGVVQTQELFRHDAHVGHRGCGQVPAFYQESRAAGLPCDPGIFLDPEYEEGVACTWP